MWLKSVVCGVVLLAARVDCTPHRTGGFAGGLDGTGGGADRGADSCTGDLTAVQRLVRGRISTRRSQPGPGIRRTPANSAHLLAVFFPHSACA